MPQAVQIETQSEEQSLTLLCAQRTTGRAGRELTRLTELNMLSIRDHDAGKAVSWEMFAASGRALHGCARSSSHAWRESTLFSPELLPDVGVIPLAIELGVGQHQPDPRLLGSRFDDRWQIGTIVP